MPPASSAFRAAPGDSTFPLVLVVLCRGWWQARSSPGWRWKTSRSSSTILPMRTTQPRRPFLVSLVLTVRPGPGAVRLGGPRSARPHRQQPRRVLGAGRARGVTLQIFKFPNAKSSTDGTIGYPIGFWVITGEAGGASCPSCERHVEDGAVCPPGQDYCLGYVLGPDDVKVEIMGNRTQPMPIQHHHIHFNTPDVDGLRAWYVEMFGAVPGMNGNFKVADLPGVNLRFSETERMVGTQGPESRPHRVRGRRPRGSSAGSSRPRASRSTDPTPASTS